ncbi:hypothetical protein GC197_12390 [bacterium]|nr:hypothetical protein [bacterium]
MLRFVLNLFALTLGIVGTIGCVAVIAGIWWLNARVSHAVDRASELGSDAISLVDNQVTQVESRIDALKIKSAEVKESITHWIKQNAAQRIGARLEIGEKLQQLQTEMQDAQKLVDLAKSTLDLAQRALEATPELGIHLDPATIETLSQSMQETETRLTQVTQDLTQITQWIENLGEANVTEEASNRIVKLAARIALTLVNLDEQFARVHGKFDQLKAELNQLHAKLIGYVNIGSVMLALFVAWLGAGQCALAYCGTLGLRRSRKSNVGDDHP